MSLGNPTNIVIIALLGIAALLFITASFTGGGKWRRLYQEESEDYAAYADRADDDLRTARQRIAELEASQATLEREHAEALAQLAQAKASAPTIEAPVAVAPPVREVVAAPVAPPAIVAEHRPIAPETLAEAADSRPIAAFGAPMTELPPAPIMGMTPLRAEEPPVPEIADAEFTETHDAADEPSPAAAEATPTPVEAAPVVEEPAKTWFGAGKRDDLTRMRGVDSMMNTRLFGLGVTSFDDVVHLSQEDEMALEQRLAVPAGYITREQWREQASLLRFGKDDEFEERFGSADA
jgi:predicted flap endonuclease-1-like 5' DNA nuclease